MACECRDENGSLLDRCVGVCKQGIIVEQEKQQQRDPMNGFAELILAQVDKRITSRLNEVRIEFSEDQIVLYKKAFLEGLKEGVALGREIYG